MQGDFGGRLPPACRGICIEAHYGFLSQLLRNRSKLNNLIITAGVLGKPCSPM